MTSAISQQDRAKRVSLISDLFEKHFPNLEDAVMVSLNQLPNRTDSVKDSRGHSFKIFIQPQLDITVTFDNYELHIAGIYKLDDVVEKYETQSNINWDGLEIPVTFEWMVGEMQKWATAKP